MQVYPTQSDNNKLTGTSQKREHSPSTYTDHLALRPVQLAVQRRRRSAGLSFSAY